MTQQDDLTQTAKNTAQQIGEDVKTALHSEADRATQKVSDQIADRVSNAANAADAAASEFSSDSLQSRAAQQVADQVENVAAHLRNSDLKTVTRDVSDFARKNPALFIGGAALLGFAATRFLKARNPDRIEYGSVDSDPWGNDPANTRGIDVTS